MICYLFTNQVILVTMKGIQTAEDGTAGMFGYGVKSLAKIPLTSPNPILLSQRTQREPTATTALTRREKPNTISLSYLSVCDRIGVM